jgi:hypothetical protein
MIKMIESTDEGTRILDGKHRNKNSKGSFPYEKRENVKN